MTSLLMEPPRAARQRGQLIFDSGLGRRRGLDRQYFLCFGRHAPSVARLVLTGLSRTSLRHAARKVG